MGQSASAVYGYGAIFTEEQKEELFDTYQEDVEYGQTHELVEYLNEYYAEKGTRFEVGGYLYDTELSDLYLICDGFAHGWWSTAVDKPSVTKTQIKHIKKIVDSLELDTPAKPSWILVASWG